MQNIGQSPVVLHKELPGFLLNRLQYALLAEAFRLVDDGCASPEDVDLGWISEKMGFYRSISND